MINETKKYETTFFHQQWFPYDDLTVCISSCKSKVIGEDQSKYSFYVKITKTDSDYEGTIFDNLRGHQMSIKLSVPQTIQLKLAIQSVIDGRYELATTFNIVTDPTKSKYSEKVKTLRITGAKQKDTDNVLVVFIFSMGGEEVNYLCDILTAMSMVEHIDKAIRWLYYAELSEKLSDPSKRFALDDSYPPKELSFPDGELKAKKKKIEYQLVT